MYAHTQYVVVLARVTFDRTSQYSWPTWSVASLCIVDTATDGQENDPGTSKAVSGPMDDAVASQPTGDDLVATETANVSQPAVVKVGADGDETPRESTDTTPTPTSE